jgi:N-carbamoylputrescine amidase
MPAMTPFRIGLVQMAMSADPDANVEKAALRVREAAREGAEVVCLPELYRSPYFCQKEDAALFDLAEPIPGPSTEALGRVAREEKVAVFVPIFERRAPGLYHNSSVLLDERGEVAGLYRKMHIPDDPLFYEKFYFTPGDLGFQAFDTAAGRVGTLICWDQWYPEGARLTALRGAQVLFYPTAIGWYHGETVDEMARQREAWRIVQRAHAITNGVFVAAINRVGVEDDLKFWGTSFVADPGGRIINQAGETDESVVIADCDLSLIESQRHGWPFLRDRRIDAYGDITRRLVD